MRILVACDRIILSGGLLRFDRFGHHVAKDGHYVAFVPFAAENRVLRSTKLDILTPEEARLVNWDATMVPGAGFPPATIDAFSTLEDPRYGIRIQHILNDQTRKDAFLRVNRSFRPHIVIFNNLHWPEGSYSDFVAEQFLTIVGGVDTAAFGSVSQRSAPGTIWTIGGLANKNPAPLLAAVERIPNIHLKLFGNPSADLVVRSRHLVSAGKVEYVGPLGETDLPAFYESVDIVVGTETFAGWANLAAEAMASGRPLICTPHGTNAFAVHEQTALIVPNPTTDHICNAIQRIIDDPILRVSLVNAGKKAIAHFDWKNWSYALTSTIRQFPQCRPPI